MVCDAGRVPHGADDYITKPFSVKELMARLQAAIRRSQAPEESQDAVITIGDIELHPSRRLVLKSGRPVPSHSPSSSIFCAFSCAIPAGRFRMSACSGLCGGMNTMASWNTCAHS
jgi:hypothetical protein